MTQDDELANEMWISLILNNETAAKISRFQSGSLFLIIFITTLLLLQRWNICSPILIK